jgi:hypothetical protein
LTGRPDLREINDAASAITVQGARLPEKVLKLTTGERKANDRSDGFTVASRFALRNGGHLPLRRRE